MLKSLFFGAVLLVSLVHAENATDDDPKDPNVICFVPEVAVETKDGETAADGRTMRLCVDKTTFAIVSITEVENENPLVAAEMSDFHKDVDTMWVIICGAMVFFMQVGFGVLEAGCISEKNVINIMFKNVMDASIAGVCYWLVGYALAYGDANDGGFIGGANFGLSNELGDSFHSFFFQWAFAATAATIVAGSVAERCKIEAYFVYSIVLTAVIYPIVSHWIWDSEGWLCAWNENATFQMIDFAGCGVVHMVGGLAGLVAAVVIGPRQGRFENGPPTPHNVLLCGMGVLFLWFGWYGFNCGSTLMVSGGVSQSAAKVAVNTTIAAASGCMTAAFIGKVFGGAYDFLYTLNGILAGLVSITSACAVVDPWAACVIAILGTIIYTGASKLLIKLKIDDPLDAAPVHGFCGMWGALVPGIFSSDALLAAADMGENKLSSGDQFVAQLVGVLCVAAWTLTTSAILFLCIKYTIGMRVDEDTETAGLDQSEHAANAYSYISQREKDKVDAEKKKEVPSATV